MAEQVGRDLILKVLEEVGLLRTEMRDRLVAMDERLAAMDERLAAQADTLLLVAATVQRLTPSVKDRIDDHEQRVVALERSGR